MGGEIVLSHFHPKERRIRMDESEVNGVVRSETLAEDAIRAIIGCGPEEAKKTLAFLQREARRLDEKSGQKLNLDERLRKLKARILAEGQPVSRPKISGKNTCRKKDCSAISKRSRTER